MNKTKVWQLKVWALLLLALSHGSLDAQTSNDVTQHLEFLGNPFAAQFPDGEAVYARNVWDMEIYQGHLYLAHGNSNNEGPAPNAGPVPVWVYDLSNDMFSVEGTVEEEQIERFVIINNQLYIPGHDPTGGSTGRIYQLTEREWEPISTISNLLHIYDLEKIDTHWIAAISSSASSEGALAISEDVVTWSKTALPAYQTGDTIINSPIAWEIIHIGTETIISAQAPIALQQADDGTTQPVTFGSSIFTYEDGKASASDLDFFPDHQLNLQRERSFRIARSVAYGDAVVYVGAAVQTSGHQWTPFMLGKIEGLSISEIPLPEGVVPWDTWVTNDALFVLASTCPAVQPGRECANRVYAACDLQTWHEVFVFQADTFARSFAYDGEDFYFGMGTTADALSRSAGDILRVPADTFDTNCNF